MTPGPPMPVVVGSPRSGTTLLRLMLDAHPQVAIPPETGFLLAAVPALHGSADRRRDALCHAVTSYPPGAPAWADFGIPVRAFRTALDEADALTMADALRTFYRMYADRLGKPRWGDKTPLYCRDVAKVLDLLPEAHVVHVVRDGRDAAVSLRRMWFSPAAGMAEQAAYWRDNVTAARAQGLGHPRYVEVRYEELVCRPEQVLRRLCVFLLLPFSPAMLRHHERAAERLAEHAARFTTDGRVVVSLEDRRRQQARAAGPVDPTLVGGWRQALDAAEAAEFERVAGPLLRELGYPCDALARASDD